MKFTLNKPFETDKPTVEVDPGLAVGEYRFRLVVVDRDGLRSRPAEAVVTISRDILDTPQPVPTPLRPVRPLPTPPP